MSHARLKSEAKKTRYTYNGNNLLLFFVSDCVIDIYSRFPNVLCL